MTVEQAIHAALIAATGVTGIVPSGRIKTPGNHQNLARPYIIHFPVSVVPARTYSGLIPLEQWGYQVSVFAADYDTGAALALAVRAALDGNHSGVTVFWTGAPQMMVEVLDSNTAIFHFPLTFEVSGVFNG